MWLDISEFSCVNSHWDKEVMGNLDVDHEVTELSLCSLF